MEMGLGTAATKRGSEAEAEEPGRKKAAGATRTAQVVPWLMDSLDQLFDEAMLKHAVARLNAANPGAPPVVPEELTEERRAALLQEDMEWRSSRKEEELAAARRYVAEQARAPPSPEEPTDPSKDRWQLDYDLGREELEMKLARREDFEGFDFERNTLIPPMCFTDNPMPDDTNHRLTAQIFTVKVAGIDGDLQWPLGVFGMVAVRDKLDYSRNVIFNRTRDNCQTLTEQDPYLVLVGPTRAVLYSGYVYFDAMLKVKGMTEFEDTDLSLVFERFLCCEKLNLCVSFGECMLRSCVSSSLYTSKLSTLELTCGLVVSSVEATIAAQIIRGSWPDGSRGQLTACIGSVGDMNVMLLDSREEKAPVIAADGTIELSRRVVSVERSGQLIVRGVVSRGGGDHDKVLAEGKASFAPLDAGRSRGTLDLGGMCKLEITVAWSRILKHPPVGGLPPTS
ncbi:hypothetical protein ACQJBY_039637 [Aegilops geniculata]